MFEAGHWEMYKTLDQGRREYLKAYRRKHGGQHLASELEEAYEEWLYDRDRTRAGWEECDGR